MDELSCLSLPSPWDCGILSVSLRPQYKRGSRQTSLMDHPVPCADFAQNLMQVNDLFALYQHASRT